jgi:hypothetical protein
MKCKTIAMCRSDIGGVSNMLKNKEEGFDYQTDAPYMLVYYVCGIFENEEFGFQKEAREHALKTHEREENLGRRLDIYKDVIC